ncbi:hypothetical protein H0H92_006237, partial [Tricholoma furcatifolium]
MDYLYTSASSRLKGNAKSRHITTRLLIVAYPSTLRIWDTTDLENIVEVLRLPIAKLDIGEADGLELVHAAVLPGSTGEARPWIGLA